MDRILHAMMVMDVLMMGKQAGTCGLFTDLGIRLISSVVGRFVRA